MPWGDSGCRAIARPRIGIIAFIPIRARWLATARLGVVEFIRDYVGSLGRTQWSSVSFGFAWVSPARRELVGIIRVRVGSIGSACYVVELIRVRLVSLCLA